MMTACEDACQIYQRDTSLIDRVCPRDASEAGPDDPSCCSHSHCNRHACACARVCVRMYLRCTYISDRRFMVSTMLSGRIRCSRS